MSDLYFEIDKAFRAAGIEIPFPQRDVHLIPPDEPAAKSPTTTPRSPTAKSCCV